jgi:hypothetical protein
MDYPLYQSGEGVGWDGTAWIWGRNYIQSILIKPSPYGLSMDMDCAVCMYICMYCMCNNGNGNTIWLLQERERERVPYCPWEACCCLCLRAVYMTSGYAHIPRCGRDIAKLGYRHIYIYICILGIISSWGYICMERIMDAVQRHTPHSLQRDRGGGGIV